MKRLLAVAAVMLATVDLAGCAGPVVKPLQLDHGTITASNPSSEAWNGVEIWINRNFRVTVPSIAAGGRLQVSTSSFVAGYGQRFDSNRMQIKDVRLTARTPDGQPVEHIMAFRQGGLEGAFGGKQ
jgi:hypothetical protein